MTDTTENNDAGNANAQQVQEDQEWDNAAEELLSSKGLSGDDSDDAGGDDANLTDEQKAEKVEADKKAADEKAAKEKADTEEAEKAANETPEQTEERHKQEAADKKAAEDAKNNEPEYDPAAATARKTQREIQQDREAYVTDIKEKLYPDLKTELEDSEGNPIRTVSDLMKLENPVTKKAFTEDEATIFLMQAKSKLAENNQKAEDRVNKVADVLITVRDEALAVKHKWGALLQELNKERPGFADRLLANYKRTLRTDPETGVIIEAPLSAEDFYDDALSGYEEARKALKTGEQVKQESQEEVKKAQVQADKARTKRDRGDITSSNNTDTRNQEDKEWDQAEQEVFGDRLASNSKKK